MFLRHLLIAVHSTIPALQPIRKFEIITVFLSANLFQLRPRFFSFYQQFWLKSLLTWSYFAGCYILLFDLVSIDNNLLFNSMESYCWYQFGSSIRRVLFDLIFFTYLFILFFISNYLKLLQLDANPEPVWPNGWVFVHELSGSGFESSCSHLNLRFRTCFEQGVPWHSGNYRVWVWNPYVTWQEHTANYLSKKS